ncbi:MAG: asparagine synthetase A [Nitrososphaerota archaeon]|jgi:asparaginyl-tRNA synthetase|uniref:asparagine synthetase A n=1 Tax=Candidatus Bathycorpusculum sp. TaxID=2994959 RepID=UPI002831A0BB|nr:asparagine synthetase A [Candidatus Termiticorpusculum sp.]MCL2257588.1 asparagine synthetase A [Candidatus Termiticorpusculum sp.]MCL2292276.1 asparagine synthetase A [Candidatus Termiticorpusculum sp.]MDR0460209.1 asparagine synthetase A [Nitrososphaerota archaeon]
MTPKEDTTAAIAAVINTPKSLDQLRTTQEIERKAAIGRIVTYTLGSLTSTYVNEGFQWLLPVILSQSTDPLWPDPNASIEKRIELDIYGKPVRTMTSMIVHKLIGASTVYPKLFTLAPNIRIERADRGKTGKHIYEFTQLDFEAQGATSKDIFTLVEKALCTLVKNLKKDLKDDLKAINRIDAIPTLEAPFKILDCADLKTKYGDTWEEEIIAKITQPTWITNIPRAFYDFEDFNTGKWDNYDLFMPQYGEVLSGAKREYEHDKIIKKLERDGVRKENYAIIIQMAKEGRLKPTAGAGLGVERVIGYITGVKHIAECQPFPRIPGIVHEL